jgi:plastocyanin
VGRSNLTVVSAVALVVIVSAAACGNGSTDTPNRPVVPGARTIDVDATTFSFDPETIRLDAGEDVTIRLHSDDVFHDFVVDGRIGYVVGAEGGDTARGGVRIDEPGSYTFYCSVTAHRATGMEGTFVVD